jgi:hypothetical protein
MAEGIAIKSASFLVNGAALTFKKKNDSYTLRLPASLPDETATVIVLELDHSAHEIEPVKL